MHWHALWLWTEQRVLPGAPVFIVGILLSHNKLKNHITQTANDQTKELKRG